MKNFKQNILIIVSIFFLITKLSFGQATLDWVKSYSFPGNNPQIAYDVVTDANGNIYMTGVHGRGYSMGDMVTVKYNSSGQYQWANTYNFTSDYTNEIGRSIAAYRNGTKTYIYVAGEVSYSGNSQYVRIIKYDENGNEKWKTSFDGGVFGVNDIVSKVMADSSGNCYITGSRTTSAYLVKYDSSGATVFSVFIPNQPGYTYANGYDMAIDPAGNIFVTGDSDSSGTRNYFTTKYNPAGVLQWSKIFKGVTNYQSSAKKIAIGTSGNIYVTGEYQSGTKDYMTIKYNSATGDTLWTRRYNGTASGTDFGRLLALDASENVYVTGVTNYTGNGDMATIKYNSSGVQQWVKVYAGSGGYLDDPKDIITDNSGKIYIAAASDFSLFGKNVIIKYNTNGDSLWTRVYDIASVDFETPYAMSLDNSGNVIAAGSSGYETNSDFGILKYNSSGALQWTRKFYAAPITNDIANGAVTDKNGNVYIVGKAKAGQGDNIFVIKYNSAGVQKWVYNTSGSGTGYDAYDAGKAIAIDTSGNVYITGTVYSHPTTFNDLFIRKLDSNGISKWFTVRNGTGTQYGNDEGNDIALDASGNVYVAGQSTGASGDLNFITIKFNSLGTELWARGYNGTASLGDRISDLEISNIGDVFVTGTSNNTGVNSDITTIKYSSIGVQQWIRAYNGNANSNDSGNALKADKLGNIYVCGSETDATSGSNALLIKYNSIGDQVWTKKFNNTNTGNESANTVNITSSDSTIYIAGICPIAFFGDTLQNCYFYYEYDLDGAAIVGVNYPVKGSTIEGSAIDHLDNFYFTGTRKTSDTGSYDNFIVKIPIVTGYWETTFSGASNGNEITGKKNPIVVDKSGNVFLAGSSYDTITGNTMNLIKYKQPLYSIYMGVFIEGFHIGYSRPDTVKVLLRNISSPYNIVDSSKIKTDYNGEGFFPFSNASVATPYYLVVKHRNSIETWSSEGQVFSFGSLYYNFKEDSTKSYGNNVRGFDYVGRKYAIFSGDVNQDGTVDATDLSLIDNDAANFTTGYVNADITGDDFVDASDAAIADNNAANFVSAARP